MNRKRRRRRRFALLVLLAMILAAALGIQFRIRPMLRAVAEIQVVNAASSALAASALSEEKVNINTAGLEELMTLKGVGESRARAIIEYREQQGAFETPEDIMNISGIKEGVFSKIKDQIAVR